MLRLDRQQLEDGILDRAAALFARRGFEQTSVQAIADAVGYSKAGLLHHYPSKEALHGAVLEQARTLGLRLVEQVGALPVGAGRDVRTVEALVDLALARPGLVSLLLGSATVPGGLDPGEADTGEADTGEVGPGDLEDVGSSVFEAFGVPTTTAGSGADRERCIRVIGASVAVGFLALAAHESGDPAGWRPAIVATAVDALGIGALGSCPGTPLPRSPQEEA